MRLQQYWRRYKKYMTWIFRRVCVCVCLFYPTFHPKEASRVACNCQLYGSSCPLAYKDIAQKEKGMEERRKKKKSLHPVSLLQSALLATTSGNGKISR